MRMAGGRWVGRVRLLQLFDDQISFGSDDVAPQPTADDIVNALCDPRLAFHQGVQVAGVQHSAADLTQAQANAIFLGERLQAVLMAWTVARRARRLMKQNLLFAVLYNAMAVSIAMAGHITPLIAALAMSGSSLLVTVNALRARRRAAQPQ
jgi:hypothetical protein